MYMKTERVEKRNKIEMHFACALEQYALYNIRKLIQTSKNIKTFFFICNFEHFFHDNFIFIIKIKGLFVHKETNY